MGCLVAASPHARFHTRGQPTPPPTTPTKTLGLPPPPPARPPTHTRSETCFCTTCKGGRQARLAKYGCESCATSHCACAGKEGACTCPAGCACPQCHKH